MIIINWFLMIIANIKVFGEPLNFMSQKFCVECKKCDTGFRDRLDFPGSTIGEISTNSKKKWKYKTALRS
jgi:hypothetical protein